MSLVSVRGKHSTAAKRSKKHKKTFRALSAIAGALAGLTIVYCVCVFSNIPFIEKWRTLYIETAMSTMRFQWLATAFIPESIIDDVMAVRYETDHMQSQLESTWSIPQSGDDQPQESSPGIQIDVSQVDVNVESRPDFVMTDDAAEFFTLFDELDRESVIDYYYDHQELFEGGWMSLKLNEASMDSDGTDMVTAAGHRVMAVDAENGILILRVKSDSYRGVLAIVKDPSMLSVANASTLWEIGQFAHQFANDYDALLVMGANGFEDEGGVGNGGTIYGMSVSGGVTAGTASGEGYKRVEIRNDDRMYIVNSENELSPDTRDAAEFKPALIMDGQQLVFDSAGWGIQPRAIIAQSSDLEIMMLVVEGRQGVSNIGITLGECAEILLQYDAVQALNMDGGSSAILVYEGEPITMCSNGYEYGRTLPNAFIVTKKD